MESIDMCIKISYIEIIFNEQIMWNVMFYVIGNYISENVNKTFNVTDQMGI